MSASLVGYPLTGPRASGSSRPATERSAAKEQATFRAEDGPGVRFERLRPDDPDRSRLEARILGASPHVEPVLDVGTAPNGDLVLVLPALPVRLPDLLEIPGWPSAGEAVTVLVPLLEAIDRLHGVGVAHGDIRPGAVRLDERGAAVLCGFEAAVLRRTGIAAFDAAVRADRAAAADLIRGLLRAAGARDDAVAALLDRGADAQPTAVIDALFAVAEPLPVRLVPHPAAVAAADPEAGGWWQAPAHAVPPAEPVPGRLGAIARGSHEDGEHGESATIPSSRRTARLLALPRPLRSAPTLAELMASPRAASIRRGLGAVRARVWAAAGVAALLLVLATVLLPGRGADAIDRPVVRPTTTSAASTAVPRPTTRAGAVAPRSLAPVRAAAALLSRRASCLAGSTAACLSSVDAAGSPVDTADRAAMSAGVAAVLPEGGAPRLLSAEADSATLDVHGCTVLVVREPAGWRLRDVVAKPPA